MEVSDLNSFPLVNRNQLSYMKDPIHIEKQESIDRTIYERNTIILHYERRSYVNKRDLIREDGRPYVYDGTTLVLDTFEFQRSAVKVKKKNVVSFKRK